MAMEAFRIAVKYMTPVLLLSDGYIANGSEPWRIPAEKDLPKINVKYRTEKEGFQPYLRDKNLARPWVKPGTPGLEHRIGGLEKEDVTGNVSYDADNHQHMVELRAKKVKNIEKDIPDVEVFGPKKGELLVLGWGGTYGSIRDAVKRAQVNGLEVAHAHLNYLNPFPKNLEAVLKNYKKVLIPELNLGQLSKIIRSEFLIPVESLNKVKGLPFKTIEILSKISAIVGGKNGKK
jgi:2-oxoglutarate ferredoxin oxidoreductase subunit alpha